VRNQCGFLGLIISIVGPLTVALLDKVKQVTHKGAVQQFFLVPLCSHNHRLRCEIDQFIRCVDNLFGVLVQIFDKV
jgi:hypothetical protein